MNKEHYPDGHAGIPLHSDAQQGVTNSLIWAISVGAERTLQLIKKDGESTEHNIKIPHGSVYSMSTDSQSIWKHGIRSEPSVSEQRISFTFRKLTDITNVPENNLKPLTNGFLVHPERLESSGMQESVPAHELLTSTSVPPKENSTSPTARHLIIGDSLVNGLRVSSDTVTIYRGGIGPTEIMQLLPGSTDVLHPDSYDNLRTVTLVVGTNVLNISKPGKGTPLLDVVEDYEKVVYNLQALFPKAQIGLYNVLPRAYTCVETCRRIELFNEIFEHVTSRLPNVSWIHQFREFLDDSGSLRHDLYGRLGIHLKGKGKGMMFRKIRSFQVYHK